MNRDFKLSYPRSFLPKQIEVLQSVKKSVAVLYSGAFRAGKTLILAHVAIEACLLDAGVVGMIVSTTETQLRSVVFTTFLHELDMYQNRLDNQDIGLKLAKNIWRSTGNMKIEFYNGSYILFRSADNERKLAGHGLDFFGMDEPIDMDVSIFHQLMGRLSGTGNLKNTFALLTTNPGSQLHWIYNYFYIKKDMGYVHIDTTTYDNVLLPNYDRYIKEKEQLWDEDWVRRYLNGKWGMFEGAIYKTFNVEKHIGDFKEIPIAYHIAGVDWGLSTPHAVVVIGVTGDKRLIIKKELYGKHLSSHELAKAIRDLHKTYKFRKVYCDPSAADLIMQTYELGVPISKGDHDVDSGIAKVNSIFKANMCLMDKTCVHCIAEHEAYRFEPGTERPKKENDHTCDAFRYAVTDYRPFYRSTLFSGHNWGRMSLLERWKKK